MEKEEKKREITLSESESNSIIQLLECVRLQQCSTKHSVAVTGTLMSAREEYTNVSHSSISQFYLAVYLAVSILQFLSCSIVSYLAVSYLAIPISQKLQDSMGVLSRSIQTARFRGVVSRSAKTARFKRSPRPTLHVPLCTLKSIRSKRCFIV